MGMLITSPATRINTLRPRQMAIILQNAFCMFSKKNVCIFIEISQKFVSNGYIANKAAQLPIRQHRFRSWLGAVQVPSHYMSQCLASLQHNGLTPEPSYICQSVMLSCWRTSLDLATSESGQFTAIYSLRHPIFLGKYGALTEDRVPRKILWSFLFQLKCVSSHICFKSF